MCSPPEPDRTEAGDAARLRALAGASIRFQPGGALRVWPGTVPIRWSDSFGGMCLGLSRVPFALSLIDYFHAERMHRGGARASAVPQVFANLRVSLPPG